MESESHNAYGRIVLIPNILWISDDLVAVAGERLRTNPRYGRTEQKTALALATEHKITPRSTHTGA